MKIPLGCTSAGQTGNWYYIYDVQTLTAAGTYTIDLSGSVGGSVSYNLTLERLSPVPPDATPIVLPANINGEVDPPTAQDSFTFYGATTGVYQIQASVATAANNVCFEVYQPGGAAAVNSTCTSAGLSGNWYVVTADLTPPQNGTYLVMVSTLFDVGTVNYTLSISCAAGTCSEPPPTCELTDSPAYNATNGTLTMNFTVGTPYAATWNAWLVSGNTMEALWSQSQPITPPVTVTKTQAVPASGTVGILSTLTTPTRGIACSSWKEVSTGKP
jgi:hypothetical protein